LLHVERDFYGVLRVTHDDEHNVNRLFHGSTLHGQQSLDPRLRREPSTYFTRSGPIGQLFEAAQGRLREPGARVAIVGLGAGTIASYAKPGQRWTFYELDPAVERIARDPRFFSYLADCPASKVEIVLGDARLKFREAADHAYSLIVLDAFSSDSLPVHLLAREAFAQYRAKLAPGGLIALNLSSRYLDLGAVVARQALDAGMTCRVRHDVAVSDDEKKDGKQPSIWGVMAESPADLGPLETDPRWRSPAPRPGSRAWTDDYSELASYLLWNPATPRGPAGS
jgi:SAM-dependent methyltransferase